MSTKFTKEEKIYMAMCILIPPAWPALVIFLLDKFGKI